MAASYEEKTPGTAEAAPGLSASREEVRLASRPRKGEAGDAGVEGAGTTDDAIARVSVPSGERREGPALIAVHMERIFIDPLTRKPLTLEELRRALMGDE